MSFTLRNASLIAVALSGLLFGCATSQKIQVVQPGDQNLSCNAIKEELARLDKRKLISIQRKGSQEPMSPADQASVLVLAAVAPASRPVPTDREAAGPVSTAARM